MMQEEIEILLSLVLELLDIDIVLQIDDNDDILFESDEIQNYSFVSEPLKELI